MTAPVSAPVEGRRCPSCSSPVSDRAAICAFCDFVLDPEAAAALAAAPTSRPRAGARTPRPSLGAFAMRLLARTAVVLGVVVAIVIGAAFAFVRMGQRGIVARAERAAAIAAADTTATDWRQLEAAIRATAGAIGPSASPDMAAAAALSGVSNRGRSGDSLWAGAPAAAPPSRQAVMPATRVAAFAALPRRPSAVLRDSLVADTLDARLALWRDIARSGPLPASWPYSSRLADFRDPIALPLMSFAATKDLAQRNASAALLAASRGDAATAVRRLRENVAAAGQVMRVPTMLNYLIGRVIVREATTMMSHVARVTRDSALAAEAAALAALAERRPMPDRLVTAVPVFFADPADPRGPAVVADRRLPPGARVEALTGVALGACLRTSELLFGVSDERRRTLDVAAAGLRDLEGADAMVAMHRSWLDDLIERPETTFRRYMRGTRRVPRIPLIGGTMARTWVCLRAI